jgi:hypothetical protein
MFNIVVIVVVVVIVVIVLIVLKPNVRYCCSDVSDEEIDLLSVGMCLQ